MLQNVVVGILKKDTKVLVALRPPHKPYGGYWEFPGGKIEPNETSEEALRRELHEELGIHVSRANFCFAHQHHYPDKTVFLEIWLVDQFIGDPYPNEEQELRWVSWDDILALRLLEGNKPILQKLKEIMMTQSGSVGC